MPQTMPENNKNDEDDMYNQLREEALLLLRQEPELSILLHRTVLAPSVVSFEDAVASTVCYRLLLHPCQSGATTTNGSNQQPSAMYCPNSLKGLLRESMSSDVLELGNTMADAIREDALAVCRRDPATDTALEVVLFSKGYAALVCHRAAHRLYKEKRKFTALFLQSQASAVFGLDIHPLAQIGYRVMLDHGTGVVVGETAVVGDGCTILHGVTFCGTGKDHGDRHPKVRKNVLIGAGASLLGNIHIGDGAKIGAGSVVLRAIPPGATAVGSPAKIIGRSKEMRPGSEIDEIMENATLLHKAKRAAILFPQGWDPRPKIVAAPVWIMCVRIESTSACPDWHLPEPSLFARLPNSSSRTVAPQLRWGRVYLCWIPKIRAMSTWASFVCTVLRPSWRELV
jgi:serine O-acetyltransferase